MLNNPFSDNNRLKKEFLETEKEVKSRLEKLRIIANDILNDTRYKDFRVIFEEAEKNTLDLLFHYKESDPYKFKTKVDEYLVELRVYKNILKSLSDLVKPKQEQKVNMVADFKNKMQGFLDKLNVDNS